MREIKKLYEEQNISVFKIKHDNPSDLTLYDYLMLKTGDLYKFLPITSTFRFPSYLEYWKISKKDNIKLSIGHYAKKFQCNPWTIKECIETIIEVNKERLPWIKT